MPNSATMSVMGLYTFNSDLFENMVVPNDVDAGLVEANILLELGELEILYPDWEFMHSSAIPIWSASEQDTWERVARLGTLDYNPIENYDRHEVETIGESEKALGMSHSAETRSDTVKNTEDSMSNTAQNVTGYNTNTPVTDNTNQTMAAGSSSGSSDGTTTNNTGSSSQLDRDRARSSHIHGNIGVTTVAQMMEGELEVYPKINIYNYITESFKRRFCITVY